MMASSWSYVELINNIKVVYIFKKLLLWLLVIMIISVQFTHCQLTCNGMEDAANCGICALCIDKYDMVYGKMEKVGLECQPKGLSIFKSPPMCDFVDKCREYTCTNHTPCETFFGTALCLCDKSHYGQTCEYNKSGKFVEISKYSLRYSNN